MGVDIFTNTGILFTLDDAVNSFFKGINKKNLVSIIDECDLIIHDKDEKHFLQNISNLDDLKSWFISFVQKNLNEDYIENQNIILDFWQIILNKTKFNILPEIRLEYFKSNRYSGYDVPVDTICVIFDDSGLFETKMTKKGESFARLIGKRKIEQTTWTVYSC